MESHKRKEVPDSAEDGATEIAERPTKTRLLDENPQETVNTGVSIVARDGADERRIQVAPVNAGTGAVAASVSNTSTIDAASLPSAAIPDSVTNEPTVVTGNLPIISTGIPVERSPELDPASALAETPKVLPKPSSPLELAHWNQMFFNLMVW